jgi:glycosyltransferase involved in cell wall biosynthesis
MKMDKLRLLYLSGIENNFINYSNNFPEALLSNDVLCLDYKELYHNYGFNGVHNYIREYINENGINSMIFFFGACEFYFDLYFFEELRKKIYVVMFALDTAYTYEVRDQYYAQAMDLMIHSDFIVLLKSREIGIDSITYWGYFDANRYHKIEDLSQNIDVSFIGQITNKIGRLNYLNYLLENKINVEIFGPDSPGGIIPFEKKIEIYNRTKINLNFTSTMGTTWLTRDYSIHKRKKHITGKSLEATMCGGFMLCEYVHGIENLFEIGKEIEIFHDKEELLEKIRYYLEHEEERENIARNGYERAIKDYDAKLCVPKLIATIDELRNKKIYKPSEIYLDKEFIRNYTTYRVLLILRFIKAGRWKFAYEELKIILKYRKLDWYQIRIFFIEEILDLFPKIKSVLKAILERNKK